MQYTNYAMKNNVFGTLSAPISSLATSIQLNTGQGQRFTADMLATLESMEGNKVTKREIVKITNVTGDTLTVIRKFAPCPSNDDANTQGQVSYSFSADDTISVYITKEHFDKIDGSINDIYNNGTNKLRTEVISGLQIKVNPGPVLVGSAYYDFAGDTITLTDNATNYVEIDEDGNLVSNTTAWGDKNTKIAIVTTSSGAVTSIEDRRLGTVGGKIGGVNIHDLTEKETLSPEDEFIVSDSENVRNNKKVKASNILGYDNGIALEDISTGDVVSKKSMMEGNTDFIAVVGNNTSNNKIGSVFYGSGYIGNCIYLYLSKTGSPSGYTVRIETDNNGEPSGNLAHNNATGNIDTSLLTNTLTLQKVDFLGDFTLNKGGKYWLVISSQSISSSDYVGVGFLTKKGFDTKLYDGSNWTDFSLNNTATLIGDTNVYSATSTLIFNLTLNKTVKLENVSFNFENVSVSLNSIKITNSNGVVEYYNGPTTNINYTLENGTEYRFYLYFSGSITPTPSGSFVCDLGSISGQLLTAYSTRNGKIFFDYSQELDIYKIELSSDLVSDIVSKIDTSIIKTFSDIIGIALGNVIKGNYINFATNNGIIKNDSWDLVPGNDYYYTNNTIAGTASMRDTKIYLGKAISNNSIRVDTKLFFYLTSPSSDIIMPFTGKVIAIPASGNQSAQSFTIDGTSLGIISVPLMKGQTIKGNNGNFALTKDR